MPDASREEVEDLFLTAVALCHGWFTGPNLGRIIAGDEADHNRRRTAITTVTAAAAAAMLSRT